LADEVRATSRSSVWRRRLRAAWSECRRARAPRHERLGETNSFYAQGGVAAVISEEDTFEEHAADTMWAGQGLCDERRVRLVVEEVRRCARVISKRNFDRVEGRLARSGRRPFAAAHRPRSRRPNRPGVPPRALRQVRSSRNITIREHAFALDLHVVG
jgi:L-aspartate oxidase